MSDHLTIEQRLARIEAQLQELRSDHDAQVRSLDFHVNGNGLITICSQLDGRIDRLEAWTREEIFARTACDEPEDVEGIRTARAVVLAELIAEAGEEAYLQDGETLADWLRAQQDVQP